MFVRMRWFTIGVLASVGMMAYVANQLRRARERFTPRAVARQTGHAVADALDAVASSVSRSRV